MTCLLKHIVTKLIPPIVPWETAKLVVPTEPLPWPAGRCERISVNSFGIGGSNVHVC